MVQGWGQSSHFRFGGWVTIWSRFGLAGRVLQSEQGEGAEAGAIPGEVAAGGGVVAVAGAVEDAGDDVAGGGEQPGGLPGPQPGGVCAEGDVTPVMEAVFLWPSGRGCGRAGTRGWPGRG